MIELLMFTIAVLVFGSLGIGLGGPLHFLLTDKSLDFGDKVIMSIYILPPVIILCCLAVYYVASDHTILPGLVWGTSFGMFSGITYSYLLRKLRLLLG